MELLGQGTFGDAWLVRSTASHRKYVIKELKLIPNLSTEETEKTLNEVRILKECCHVNIIRFKESFVSSHSTSGTLQVLNIVMEYADAGDLQQCIKRHREVKKMYFAESQIRNWLIQIAFALNFLHGRNILHRDLKTQNVFMTSYQILKLGDFGISRTLKNANDFAMTSIGTPQYLSPEICKQQPYNHKSDIWSLGCVLYELAALQPAFPARDFPTLMENIVRGSYKPIPKEYTESLAELVKVLLRPAKERRPSAEQLLGAKVLADDVERYMSYIRTLPQVTERLRNGSSSSLGSTGGSTGGGCGDQSTGADSSAAADQSAAGSAA